jgi:sulfate adenylyltransferase subunit 2
MTGDLNQTKVWDTPSAYAYLQSIGQADSKRTAERRLHEWGILGPELGLDQIQDEEGQPANTVLLNWAVEKARQQRKLVLFTYWHKCDTGQLSLQAHDARGARYWLPLTLESNLEQLSEKDLELSLQLLQAFVDKDIFIVAHGAMVKQLRQLTPTQGIHWCINAYPSKLELAQTSLARTPLTPHLKRLEAESIFIIREALAESENPVMLYSLGKDSSVMLHLARKAFYPSPPPFPLMHVDTRWKFQEMYQFRDHMAQVSGMELLVHINPEAIEKNINPFDHGSSLHTDITKTEGLKQALNQHQFDVIFGGARRDEEKSRAKERIFSFRTATHRWEPKQQRPELWNLYNTRKNQGESIRVFPLSNWTELDIWQYIHHEQIPVVPLYFAKKRPVVNRNGMLLMVDDARFRLLPDEEIVEKMVRFRTLGCYPLTGAIESEAQNLTDIILELLQARQSERQGRAIDNDASASMEKKKQEGYF